MCPMTGSSALTGGTLVYFKSSDPITPCFTEPVPGGELTPGIFLSSLGCCWQVGRLEAGLERGEVHGMEGKAW